jgi:hypothetical protein
VRRRSNTPLQALNLLNDPVFLESATALGVRVLLEAPENFGQRLDYAFLLCLGRAASEHEKQALAASFERQKAILDQEPKAVAQLAPSSIPGLKAFEIAAWANMGRVLMNLDEFITRE